MTQRDTLKLLNTGSVALTSIAEGFYDEAEAARDAHPVEPEKMPEACRKLLVHHDHMTVTLAKIHGRQVELQVLDHRRDEERYNRKIVLVLLGTKQVVEFGLVRLNLGLVPAIVRDEIIKRETPLGDILIRHNVMRRIDPKWYFRFGPQSPFVQQFTPAGLDGYGRVAIIHCNNQPAIQLLEVVPAATGS